MLVKRELCCVGLQMSLHMLPSNMGRRLLVASFPADSPLGSFTCATVHLESLANTEYRVAQLGMILPIVKNGPRRTPDPEVKEEEEEEGAGADADAGVDVDHVGVLCGDFNFAPTNVAEEEALGDVTDCWKTVHPTEEGPTCGSRRIDRVVCVTPSNISPVSMRRLGVDKVSVGEFEPLLPSDHQGLTTTLSIKRTSK